MHWLQAMWVPLSFCLLPHPPNGPLHHQSQLFPPPPSPSLSLRVTAAGNDLARAIGWGPGHSGDTTEATVMAMLRQVVSATSTELDLWTVAVTERPRRRRTITAPPAPTPRFMTNYMCWGVGAHITYQFHTLRQNHPSLFFSRIVNKVSGEGAWWVLFSQHPLCVCCPVSTWVAQPARVLPGLHSVRVCACRTVGSDRVLPCPPPGGACAASFGTPRSAASRFYAGRVQNCRRLSQVQGCVCPLSGRLGISVFGWGDPSTP